MADADTLSWQSTVTPMSQAAIVQLIDLNNVKAEQAHGRLRSDLRDVEERLLAVERMLNAQALQLSRPTDVANLNFGTRTVVAIVISVVGLAGAQWGLNARLESTVMTALAQNARVQEERYQSQKEAIEELRRRVELTRAEMTSFKENVLLRDRSKR